MKSNQEEEDEKLVILTNKIIKIVKNGYPSYTFAIKKNKKSEGSYQNLVILKLDSTYKYFRIKYYKKKHSEKPYDRKLTEVTEDSLDIDIDSFSDLLKNGSSNNCPLIYCVPCYPTSDTYCHNPQNLYWDDGSDAGKCTGNNQYPQIEDWSTCDSDEPGGNEDGEDGPNTTDGSSGGGGSSGGSGVSHNPPSGPTTSPTDPGLEDTTEMDEYLQARIDALNLGLNMYQENYLGQYTLVLAQIEDFRAIHSGRNARVFFQDAIDALMSNSSYNFPQYVNWFFNDVEGLDFSYDANYWEDENLTFQQQTLPSWNDYFGAYPKNTDGTWMTGPDNVFGHVGGEVWQARLDFPSQTTNTCALKVSIALNGAGINIPKIITTNGNPGTLKGADGKYYFLNAKSLNAWMRKTFGTNPVNPNHFHYTAADGGTNGENFPSLLSGKKGIYSMISNDPNWSSGHADILLGNLTCAAGCYFSGPVQYIDIWVLD